jgi:hypothetical protein
MNISSGIKWIMDNPKKNIGSILDFIYKKQNNQDLYKLFDKYQDIINYVYWDDFCKTNGMIPVELSKIPFKPQLYDGEFILTCFSNEIIILCTLAKYSKNIFEIGTLYGFTSCNMSYFNKGIVYTLDCLDWGKVRKNNNVINFIADSMDFNFKRFHNSIDMFYIDGGHSYDVVKSDTVNAWDCIRQNGFLIWHDIYGCIDGHDYSGCTRAILEFVNEIDGKLYWIEGTRLGILKKLKYKEK